MVSKEVKEEHDRLLAEKPDEVVHDDCPICQANENHPGGDVKTYDESEFTAALSAAVEEATAPLKAELADFKAKATDAEVEAQIAALKTEHDTAIEAVKSELDVATVAKSAAETALAEAEAKVEEIKTWLEAEAEALAEAALVAERVEAREEAVKDLGLDEDYVKANLERWTAMDDDQFTAYIQDVRTAAGVEAKAPVTSGAPISTAMSGTRTPSAKTSASGDVFAMLRAGVDPRTS